MTFWKTVGAVLVAIWINTAIIYLIAGGVIMTTLSKGFH